MTDGSMTGRPYGGVNEKTSDVLPGERPNDDQDKVPARPEQEPRAAQGPMSDDVPRVPDGGAAEGADTKAPGMPDATGPTG